MTTRRRPPKGDEIPCGQNGCYHPESSRNLMWCMYVNYWRYSCLKPEGVDIIPPPAPAPAEGREEQIGAPVRIPAGPGTNSPNEDQGPESQGPEEILAEANADDSAGVPDGEAGAQGEEETQVTESSAPEPVKEFQTSFTI